MGNLKEELARFNAINKYTQKLLNEQEPPMPAAGATPPPPPPAGDAAAGDPALPPPPPPAGDAAAETPPADAAAETPPADGETPEVADDTAKDDSTEEIDITDLVNMTKSIKQQLDTTQGQDNGATQKMDDVFSKLGELETRLGEMDSVLAKIDQLGAKIDQVKPKTPIEKLEMRSLDSYPFSKKPDEFFSDKQQEMRDTGKNEYVLTKDDVENYGKYDIMKSFNPRSKENPNNY